MDMTPMLPNFVQFITSVMTINQKYLECGHTQTEVDSVHSVIMEQAKKGTQVFIPKDWINITQKAEKTNPYLVPLLNHDDLKDAKFFVADQKCNLKLLATGKKIDWRQVRWI